jgi:hypothetical protein
MFYRKETDEHIVEGKAFTINGVQYPSNWLNLSTAKDKALLGLEEVKQINEPANREYYWVQETLKGAELSYVNTPKDLVEIKNSAKMRVNVEAFSLLKSSDWMVIKALETNNAVPEAWAIWRESIRARATDLKDEIELAPHVDAVATIVATINWPADPTNSTGS